MKEEEKTKHPELAKMTCLSKNKQAKLIYLSSMPSKNHSLSSKTSSAFFFFVKSCNCFQFTYSAFGGL